MRPENRLKAIVLGLMAVWVAGALWYFSKENAEVEERRAATKAATPPPVTWTSSTAGWALPMPDSPGHAGIGVRNARFVPEADGARLQLDDILIERRADLVPQRSELRVTLRNVAYPHAQRQAPRTKFGDHVQVESERVDLLPAAAGGERSFRLERMTAVFQGRRAACREEPCYAYLTLDEWEGGRQHTSHSRPYKLNY